eukprot:PhM_4_TR15533/c0_g1_i1/m.12976/K01712/hutU, UROC1; urocanate hydratase
MSDTAAVKDILAKCLTRGIPLDPMPPAPKIGFEHLDPSVPHAPKRAPKLTPEKKRLCVKNALRYFPQQLHATLAHEFAAELEAYGHIYMTRFRPTEYEMKAYDISLYPTQTPQAAAIIHMIMNNLNPAVAMYPHELITYGGNGAVLGNWAQYHLVMRYLCEMTTAQTLVMYSGHPAGLFPSQPHAPRVVITNGMVVPNYSSKEQYEEMYALGVSLYGQMTAGSYCYIGPQGIVHGTTITVRNAGRKYLNVDSLDGKVFISSGLGGMSGAQAKAGTICNAVTIIAEVDPAAVAKRHAQGWVMEVARTVEECLARAKRAVAEKEAVSIAYEGNVVALLEAIVREHEDAATKASALPVHLLSDQTSLHNPFGGGYQPVQLSFEDGRAMISADPDKFKALVQESLRRHVAAVNRLAELCGTKFWDYGNSFLLEAGRAGADIFPPGAAHDATTTTFRYPSYVQDIMGDIFSLGFGPFRWVCTSGKPEDLAETDKIAADVIRSLMSRADTSARSKGQHSDNLLWIEKAGENRLVVGSQARILYSDCEGRMEIAVAFNEAIRSGRISAPVVLSRDHHDVSGTDSPFRETSNIFDGSQFCADMAVQNFVGDAMRGATWVALHNGGGTGWGEVINGGFGLVLDGTDDATSRAREMLFWDVLNGVNRRAWCGNENAYDTIGRQNEISRAKGLQVTMPVAADDDLLAGLKF